jgi:hypothetical protein
MCVHWLNHGDCSYGKERCNFAHGDDDLISLTEPSAAKPAATTKKPDTPQRAAHPQTNAPAVKRVRSANSASCKSPDLAAVLLELTFCLSNQISQIS